MKNLIQITAFLALPLLGTQVLGEDENIGDFPALEKGTWLSNKIKTGDFGDNHSVPSFHSPLGGSQAPTGFNFNTDSDVVYVPRLHENQSPPDLVKLQQSNILALYTLQDENKQLKEQVSRYQKLVEALNLRISELEKKQ